MLKISTISQIVLASILFLSFKNDMRDKVTIEIQILDSVRSSKILIKVKVENPADKPISVLKNRRWDFKWERFNSLGNYIVIIEKNANNQFRLLSPTADINPVYWEEEYIKVNKNQAIVDTITINGKSFGYMGFQKGNYRIRVAFNSNEWSSSFDNISQWLSFKIN